MRLKGHRGNEKGAQQNRYLSSWLVEDDEQYSSATQFRTWTISVKPDKHANSIVLLELKAHNVYVLTNSNFGKVVIIMEYTKVVMIITAELSRAKRTQWTTMDNKIWLSMPPRRFGNDVTVGALSAPQAYQCKITKSTGMPTQMQHEVFWREIACPPPSPRLFREKNNNNDKVDSD